MTILPKPVSRRKKITRKKHYWKNCQVSENSKNDIRTTPNKPYRTKRKLSTICNIYMYGLCKAICYP
jgi:hypothetical protein